MLRSRRSCQRRCRSAIDEWLGLSVLAGLMDMRVERIRADDEKYVYLDGRLREKATLTDDELSRAMSMVESRRTVRPFDS